MLRVPYDLLESNLARAFGHLGLASARATLSARLFAETTRDGVYTHGLSRFPRYRAMIANGSVNVLAEPIRIADAAALERWDGRRGPGNLNAHACMDRAIELARRYSLGAVALANTNHWMRGGTYGWQAADAGVFAICWTNTMPNLPAWGTADPVLGNNPLIIATPRTGGHVVLDMAMSQFSYGALAKYASEGTSLPVPGGYDTEGNLTQDAAAIEVSQRALAIGYWKGSGLALVLDMLAAMLSAGLATHGIPRGAERESGISQFFLAIDPSSFATRPDLDRIANAILDSVHHATPLDPAHPVRYPGEETLRLREENLRLGVPVEPAIWQSLVELAGT